MGLETLPDSTTVASGLLIKSADFLTTNAALQGAFVGRNTSGVPTSGQSLGTELYPWGNVHTDSITVGGSIIDVSQITSPANRVVSGAVRTTSGQPQFLQANGAAASVEVLGLVTNLVLSIKSTSVTVSTDIEETGLTTAPGSNNTCAINNTAFTDQAESKYFGEIDSLYPIIHIDTVGSEISSRVGQFIALKTGTSEIMWGWLKSATEFTNVKRGYFFDSTDPNPVPIVRETLANNDTLTLMETGWIFVQNDGTTVDVTYLTPVYAYTAPGSPATSQYWYDLSNVTWKRWSGSAWVDVGRVPVGLCVIDSTNCIATRPFDFYGNFQEENTLDCEVFSDEVVRSALTFNSVNVYGTDVTMDNYPVEWDNTADMETGAVAADTEYYLYISTDGQTFISLERPYDRTGDLRGRYHPYNNWRYVCKAKTDGSSDWLSVLSASTFDSTDKSADFETSKDLAIDVASNATSTLTCSKMKLLNSEGAGAFLFNVDDTFDMTLHLESGTSEKASHWYWKWKDSYGNLRLVPDLTGTADSDVLNSLSATGLTFQTDLVQRWDEIYQTTDGTKGYVKAVSSQTVLTCMDKDGNDLDLFPLGTEDFKIRKLSPEGLGQFKGRIGAVYNNGSSNLDDSTYTQIQEEKEYSEEAGDFTLSGTGWATIHSPLIPYQVNDWTGLGKWRLKGNIGGSMTSTSGFTLTTPGITYATERSQAIIAINNSASAVTMKSRAVANTSTIITNMSAAQTSLSITIDVDLASKPTFHT
jgi:hypothetical protein